MDSSKARVVVLPHVSTVTHAQGALMTLIWAWFVAGSPVVILNRWEGNGELIPSFTSG